MMTSSNGNIFRVTGHLCGEFTGPGEFPAQRPVTRNFDVFFDLRLNKRLSKQPWGWWFETLSRPLWRHCNVSVFFAVFYCDLIKDYCIYIIQCYFTDLGTIIGMPRCQGSNLEEYGRKTHINPPKPLTLPQQNKTQQSYILNEIDCNSNDRSNKCLST